jgi:hypothetical protein
MSGKAGVPMLSAAAEGPWRLPKGLKWVKQGLKSERKSTNVRPQDQKGPEKSERYLKMDENGQKKVLP